MFHFNGLFCFSYVYHSVLPCISNASELIKPGVKAVEGPLAPAKRPFLLDLSGIGGNPNDKTSKSLKPGL
jgi:hypothetical protein